MNELEHRNLINRIERGLEQRSRVRQYEIVLPTRDERAQMTLSTPAVLREDYDEMATLLREALDALRDG